MNLRQHHSKDNKSHEEDHRRAEAFLSSWFELHSFNNSGSTNDNGSIGFDGDDNSSCSRSRGQSCSRSLESISSISISLEDKNKEGDLGIGMSAGMVISDDDFEADEDDDEFDAGDSALRCSIQKLLFNEDEGDDDYNASCSTLYNATRRPFYTPVEQGHTHTQAQQGYHRGSKAKSADLIPPDDNQIQSKRKVVSRLSWRDHRGVLGKYTGEVNDRKQPHGNGALIYEDGYANTSVWKDGIPVKFWMPGGTKMKRQEQTSRSSSSKNATNVGDHNSTFLPHLDLGDVGTTKDMNTFESILSKPIALERMNCLRVHDFAFILRSHGQWTYAIIADKQDDAIRFVMNANGDTKVLSRKRWYSSIRLVNPTSTIWARRER